MKIYNQLWEVIESPDLDLGYLQETARLIIHRYEVLQKEVGHYETVKVFENGGEDVKWIIDIPEEGKWITLDENSMEIDYNTDFLEKAPRDRDIKNIEKCYIYIPYTLEELNKQEEENLKPSTDEIIDILLGMEEITNE